VATYSGDGNFAANSNTTGNTSSVTVEDANISIALTQEGKATGTNDYVTQGYSSATDFFNKASITLVVATAGGFSDDLNLSCSVASIPAGQPVTDPSCAISAASESGTQGTYTAVTITLSASASAAVGEYGVTVSAKDQTTSTFPMLTSQVLNLFVVPVSGTLDIASGSTGTTASLVFNTAGAAAGDSLSNFSCPEAVTSGDTPVTFSVSCTGTATAASGNLTTTIPIVISFSATATATASTAHSSATMFAAAFSTPFLALLTWIGSRKSGRRNFFRFLGMVLVVAGLASLNGCGGSFTGPTFPITKGIAPGTYFIEAEATDASNHTYFTVISVQITQE
jgi:hypothetical protein